MRIAILQRDPLQRQTIEKILVQASHTCVTFDDGLSMSKALARSTVDMLVLDWHGLRLSGVDVLKSVRAVGGDRMPVVFASADNSEEAAVRAFAAGADDYVSLPVRPAEFPSASPHCCGVLTRTATVWRASTRARITSTRIASSSRCVANRCSCRVRSTVWRRCSLPTSVV